jgi:hypothetical protein
MNATACENVTGTLKKQNPVAFCQNAIKKGSKRLEPKTPTGREGESQLHFHKIHSDFFVPIYFRWKKVGAYFPKISLISHITKSYSLTHWVSGQMLCSHPWHLVVFDMCGGWTEFWLFSPL